MKDYFDKHGGAAANHQILFESDAGTFATKGLGITASEAAMCVVHEVLQLTSSLNTTEVICRHFSLSPMQRFGILAVSLHNKVGKSFSVD